MALRGGYQIIDLKNKPFDTQTGNTETYPEIYDNILKSHAKFIVLSGLNMDGIKWGDREIIIYEQNNGDGVYFQAELRRIWNTSNKTCTTKYINIYPNDTVKLSYDTFYYEPDKRFWKQIILNNIVPNISNGIMTISMYGTVINIQISCGLTEATETEFEYSFSEQDMEKIRELTGLETFGYNSVLRTPEADYPDVWYILGFTSNYETPNILTISCRTTGNLSYCSETFVLAPREI